jgi:hypothetical protein
MFREILCRKLKIVKRGDGKYVWLQFLNFYFLKKIKLAFNNYIMYLVYFELLKSLELTNDHLQIENLERNLIWGPLYDATININNILLR